MAGTAPVTGRNTPARARTQRGLALPLLLLLLLALTLLAHGTLLLAQREFMASKAFLHATRATQAARSALVASLDPRLSVGGPGVLGESTSLVGEWLDDGLWRGASIRWLGRELFFLEGEGRSRGWAGIRRVGAVGWVMDPLSRIAAFQGGVEVGGGFQRLGESRTSVDGFLGLPRGWEEADCSPYEAALDSLFPSGTILLFSPLPAGGGEADPAEPPGLGFLKGDHLRVLGGREEGMGSEVAPLGSGLGCPGSEEPAFFGTEDSLELGSGWSCGLLVVGGDLVLDGDGLFQGVALVRGDLHLGGSWTFQGMARVGGAVILEDHASLEISGCSALRALSGVDALREPSLLPGASGISSF